MPLQITINKGVMEGAPGANTMDTIKNISKSNAYFYGMIVFVVLASVWLIKKTK